MTIKRRTVTFIVAVGVLTVPLVAVVSWSSIVERYYAWQLEDRSSDDDEAWTIARKLDAMRSRHAEDWYLERLKDERWNVRERAAEGLGRIASVRALEHLLVLDHPDLEKSQFANLYSNYDQSNGVVLLTEWPPEEKEAALRVLSKRLELAGGHDIMNADAPGSIQIAAGFGSEAPAAAALNTLSTIARVIQEGGQHARTSLERVAKSTEDPWVRDNAIVCRHLIEHPAKIRPLLYRD